MELLIKPSEVAERCFGGDMNIAREFITEAVIASAQQNHIRPVVGEGLWAQIEGGRYPRLAEEYLKPALALYVKRMVLPELAAQPGIMGIVAYSGRGFGSAGEKQLANLGRSLNRQAGTLMQICMEHISSCASEYPEYDPRENIRESVSILGGVVL